MKKENKIKSNRDHVLSIKVTADEKNKITDFASERCINVSALVRKLLFEQMDKNKC